MSRTWRHRARSQDPEPGLRNHRNAIRSRWPATSRPSDAARWGALVLHTAAELLEHAERLPAELTGTNLLHTAADAISCPGRHRRLTRQAAQQALRHAGYHNGVPTPEVCRQAADLLGKTRLPRRGKFGQRKTAPDGVVAIRQRIEREQRITGLRRGDHRRGRREARQDLNVVNPDDDGNVRSGKSRRYTDQYRAR